MAKRKLSQQQKTRIQSNQQQRIKNSRNSKHDISEDSLGPEQPGLVIARYSRHADIKATEGSRKGDIIRSHMRANIQSIAVGDNIIWRETPQGEGIVVAVEERHSLIERPDGLGNLKPVAANIDQVFIVFAVEPEPHPNLIDRYLIAAENANIEAKLVFNKIDLLLEETNPYSELLDTYRSLGYEVFEMSCDNHEGLDTIRLALQNKISVFAGQSGVGKSSMINALLPEVDAKVGALSDHVTKGRHTTTTSSLFELPEGGYLIDSPGIREFHLNHFDKPQIYTGYRELHDALGTCRFRDCQHKEEPGCAIKELIDNEKLAPSRIQSLSYILNSLES